MRRVAFILLSCALVSATSAEMVEIIASKDTTIYSDATSTPLSNGSGQYLFAGNTGENDSFAIRRGLVHFDLASYLPAGVVVTSATLRLYVTRRPPTSNPTDPIYAHLAAADWGEGASDPSGPEGSGAGAEVNDATWFHSFYSTSLWSTAGGDFAATASGVVDVGDVGAYFMESAGLAADAQFWYANPTQNYGWFLLGQEGTPQTARRFSSLNSGDPDTAPTLILGYAVVPEPSALLLISLGSIALVGSGLRSRPFSR